VSAVTSTTPKSTTELALIRTRLAEERTLMAWVRTSTALISFGLTIYKFFQYVRQQNPGTQEHLLSARAVALVMIGLGVSALVVATIQHRRTLKMLLADQPGPLPHSLSTWVAGVLAVFGTAGLVLVLMRQ
jgi:putative membrane protein